MNPIILGALLILITIGIGLLCWVWMNRSRSAQERLVAQNERIISLLEEQNALLLEKSDRHT